MSITDKPLPMSLRPRDTRPFVPEEIDDLESQIIKAIKPEEGESTKVEAVNEREHSSFHILNRMNNDRTLFMFLEIDGYPILRLSTNNKSQDLILNSDQVKLLLRQMTLWLTR